MKRTRAERKADAERWAIAERQRRARRAELKDRIDRLRFAARDSRRRLREEVPRVREACRQARKLLKARIAIVRAELARLLHVERPALRKRCKNEPREVRARLRHEVAERVRELAAARGYVAEVRRRGELKITGLRRPNKRDAIEALERLEHSDHEVEVSIPPELVPAWHARRAFTEPTAHASRLEVFLEWAQDHPSDAARYRLNAEEDPRVLEALVELEKREHERSARPTPKPKRRRAPHVDARLEAQRRQEFDRGWSMAARELIGDHWSREVAAAFLEQASRRFDPFSVGYDTLIATYRDGAELRELAGMVRPSERFYRPELVHEDLPAEGEEIPF